MDKPNQDILAFLSKVEQLNLTARTEDFVIKGVHEALDQKNFGDLEIFLNILLRDLLKPIETRDETKAR